MKAVVLCLALTIGAGSLPALAQAPKCPQKLVDVLARQEVTLSEWKGHLDQLGRELDTMDKLVGALHGTRRGLEIATTLKALADGIKAITEFLRARAAFATAERVAQDFPDEAAAWRAHGNRHRDAFHSEAVDELLDMTGLTPNAVIEKVAAGTIDAVHSDLKRETDQLRRGLRDDYLALSVARRAWREAHERCLPDLQVVPSPIAGRTRPPSATAPPSAPTPPQSSSQPSPPRAAATPAAPRARPPDNARANPPGRAVATPAAAGVPQARPAQRPIVVRRGLDLDALDRMAEDNRDEPREESREAWRDAPRGQPSSGGRPLSQEAYLAACQGKETTPGCHRVHCLHVGAALGDEKWTARCLRGD